MTTETEGTTASDTKSRFEYALDSLDKDITMPELAYMLIVACEEVMEEGKEPLEDPAVAVISGRVGFASVASSMNSAAWNKLIEICKRNIDVSIRLKAESIH